MMVDSEDSERGELRSIVARRVEKAVMLLPEYSEAQFSYGKDEIAQRKVALVSDGERGLAWYSRLIDDEDLGGKQSVKDGEVCKLNQTDWDAKEVKQQIDKHIDYKHR